MKKIILFFSLIAFLVIFSPPSFSANQDVGQQTELVFTMNEQPSQVMPELNPQPAIQGSWQATNWELTNQLATFREVSDKTISNIGTQNMSGVARSVESHWYCSSEFN